MSFLDFLRRSTQTMDGPVANRTKKQQQQVADAFDEEKTPTKSYGTEHFDIRFMEEEEPRRERERKALKRREENEKRFLEQGW